MDTAFASILEAWRCFMKRVRRAFTPEFKQEAVRQVTELGRPASQVARELDLRPEQLRQWKKELARSGTVSVSARSETLEEENRRLRRELAVLRQEHEFLGKAAAFFAKGSARGAP
jgi:transposase